MRFLRNINSRFLSRYKHMILVSQLHHHLFLSMLLNQRLLFLLRFLPSLIQTLECLLWWLTLIKIDPWTDFSWLLRCVVINHSRRQFVLLLNQHWLGKLPLIKLLDFIVLVRFQRFHLFLRKRGKALFFNSFSTRDSLDGLLLAVYAEISI